MRLGQIFGYDLDFYTDPRKVDHVSHGSHEKKKYDNGASRRHSGRILARNTLNAGRKYQLCCFTIPTGRLATIQRMESPLPESIYADPTEVRRAGKLRI